MCPYIQTALRQRANENQMALLTLQETLGESAMSFTRGIRPAAGLLSQANRPEVLDFLATRPIHNVFMTGLIRDNGIVSPFNRGSFYGYRNSLGMLEGIALIGHAVLFDARTEAALDTFAKLARNDSTTRLIVGEETKVDNFWRRFEEVGRTSRLTCRELLMEQCRISGTRKEMRELRPATFNDLGQVVAAHTAMAKEEIAVNPMEIDPIGFRLRVARRISKGRVWVLIEKGRLIFKADIVSDTPEVIYLEGVYVRKDARGKGYGSGCLASMGHALLDRTESISLIVHADNERAQAMYRKAGFQLRSYYKSIFLNNP